MQSDIIMGYNDSYKYVPNTSKPKCIVIDLDSTLIDETLKFMISMWLTQNVHRVVFLTSKDESHRVSTMKWINKNIDNVRFSIGSLNAELFMQPVYPSGNDVELKSKFFELNIANKYNVTVIFDSVPESINIWTSIGLKVWSQNSIEYV
jgi:hypothetical protein